MAIPMTPWAVRNERANAIHLRALAYERAIRNGWPVALALAALLRAIRAEAEGE